MSVTLTVLPGIRAMTVCPYPGSPLSSFIQLLVPYNHYYSFSPLSELHKLKRHEVLKIQLSDAFIPHMGIESDICVGVTLVYIWPHKQ